MPDAMGKLRTVVGAMGVALAFGLLGLVATLGSNAYADEPVEPLALEHPLGKSGPVRATYSTRSLSLALEIDRHQARLVRYTVKRRPFRRLEQAGDPKAADPGDSQELEVTLLGPDGRRLSERVDLSALCLAHDPEAEPHVEGDTIRLHRDMLIVELPELRDFDRVEVAYELKIGGSSASRSAS